MRKFLALWPALAILAYLLSVPAAHAQFDGCGPGFCANGSSGGRDTAPALATPSSGTFYVSCATPTVLPAGSDANPGTAAAPFASLVFALAQVPASGDYYILADGTCTENDGSRLILKRVFTKTVVIDSFTANPANFIITNAAGTAGVVVVRGNTPAANIQIRHATLRSSTDSNSIFRFDPSTAAISLTNIGFYDSIIEGRTQSALSVPVINLVSGVSTVNGLYFIRDQFKRTVGGSTVNNPIIAGSTPGGVQTFQPYSNIGFWDCSTTDSQWYSFSVGWSGINTFTFVRNNIQTGFNYGLLTGKDSSGGATNNTTNIYVAYNTFTATGSNPHAILIGENSQAPIVVKYNSVNSLLQGIVTKGSLGAVVSYNTIMVTPNAGTPSALYAKASNGTQFLYNNVTVDGSAFSIRAFSENLDNANKASNTTLYGNSITASGVNAQAIFWVDGTGSTGGAVSNNNTITLINSATLGVVRGVTTANLAAVQAAWVSNGLPGDQATNDSATTVH